MMWTLVNVTLMIGSMGLYLLVAWRYPENSWAVILSYVFGGFVVGWLLRDLVNGLGVHC